MKRLFLLPLLLLSLITRAQDPVYRIILIGDAGELGKHQAGVLTSAAGKVLKGKTTALFLGDNIYPTGMGLPGSKEEEGTKKILQMQYKPLRAAGAPVYFIPGNHDWDRMGPKGLAKIKRAGEYLAEQKDSLLKMVPAKGCPDPTEITINDELVVIAFDSEWWLYVYDKDNPDADCNCKTNEEVIDRFKELLYKNRNKIIILADHHPFETYGHHGGSYIWQDYLFPLTSVKGSLYIPLPGLGLLYPILRSTFDNPEDQGFPLYKIMMQEINQVFKIDSNVVRVSGHEHGLQFINDHGVMQIVSGSGAKTAVVKKGKHSLFALKENGYVTVDLLKNKSMKFTYYANNVKDSVYKQVYTYTRPFIPVHIPVEKSDAIIKEDSISVAAAPSFDKHGKIHRLIYGENYRKEWAVKATLPIIKIDEYQGGLKPVGYGGTHQTKSLMLKNKEGKSYVMSSIEKYPLIKLPQALRQTFATAWLQDAMSAQYPYGAVLASQLAEAVKVKHTNPTIGWVAPDPHLGFYEKEFAGKICLIDEREPGIDSSLNTGNMIKLLNANYNNRVDSIEFFKARLLDWFLGDWDEHEDQWRWQATMRNGVRYFTAIPRDRAEAFTNQGIIPKIASREWVARYLKGYSGGQNTINDFYFNDHTLNARFMTQIGHEQWMQITRNFAAALSDQVLENALRKLPLAVYAIRHKQLLALMQKRRNSLMEAAETYYRFFNWRVDIKATDLSEHFSIRDTLNGSLIVQTTVSAAKSRKNVLFSRIFDPKITREIRLYISKGDDEVFIDKKISRIKVRVIGGNGHKQYNIVNADRKVNIYEKLNTATFTGPAKDKVDKHLSNDTSNVAYIPTNPYHTTLPLGSLGFNFDEGVYIDAGFKYIHQGFRKDPGSSQQGIFGHSFGTNANRLSYTGEWVNAFSHADAEISVKLAFPKVINFFGRGNQTPFNKVAGYQDYYRARFDLYNIDATLRFQNIAGTTSLRIGPSIQYYHPVNDNDPHLTSNSNLIHTYDSTTVNKDKMHAGLYINYTNDKRDNKTLTSWGTYVNVRIYAYGGVGNFSQSFIQALPEAILYKSVDARSNFVISERLGGGITVGKTTFYQSVFLGGDENLIGFKQNRFAGQQMMYNNLEARLRLSSLFAYITQGQFGVTAAWDVGRVWVKREFSNEWHHSFGGGMYFAPSDMALMQVKGGFSKEGFYPYFNFSLTFLAIHTKVIDIREQLQIKNFVKEQLSFRPFINYLQDRIENEKTIKAQFYQFVINKFNNYPNLKNEGIAPEQATNYTEILELVYTILSPTIEDERKLFWALSTPTRSTIVFTTDAFADLLKEQEKLKKADRLTDRDFKQRQMDFAYRLVLERLYNFPADLNNDNVYALPDVKTKLTKYYRIHTDTRFIEITYKTPLPDINPEIIEPFIYDGADTSLLTDNIPLDMFTLEGFSIISMEDVTAEHSIETIRLALINAGQNDLYKEVINAMQTLAGNAAINFGLLPFLRINGQLIFDTVECGNSLLVKTVRKHKETEADFNQFITDYIKNPTALFFNTLSAKRIEQYPFLKTLKDAGITSYATLPVFYNKHLAGILEIHSAQRVVFYEKLLSQIQTAIPLISQLLHNTAEQLNEKLEDVIKTRFTALRPSVQWKFNEAAWQYLLAEQAKDKPDIKAVSFHDVYPMYGVIDIRDSTIYHNQALKKDTEILLTALADVVRGLKDEIPNKRLAVSLVNKQVKWVKKIKELEKANDETMLKDFLQRTVAPYLMVIKGKYSSVEKLISIYEKVVDENGDTYKHRRDLEKSVKLINRTLENYFDQAQTKLQKIYPCYFEKFRSDGIEYDIYTGQDIAPAVPFNDRHLKAFRQWQLKAMLDVAALTNNLLQKMPVPLQTASLIFVHSSRIDICFRNDERRFDVEGYYNIRYEVIKKRIDKVCIKNSKERLTQPGKIALVYFNDAEAEDYITLIKKFQKDKSLKNDIQFVELENLQGVSGLKALRVSINYQQ